MTVPLDIQFVPLTAAPLPTLVVLAGEEMALAPPVRAIDERTKGGLARAARAGQLTGKPRTAIEILAPADLDVQRLIVAGAGRAASEYERLRLGGFAFAQIAARKTEQASLIAALPDTGEAGADTVAADLALGALLRSYAFNKYRTQRKAGNGNGEDGEREAREGLQ
jgi:leucyl aminopeptidase